MLQRGFFGGSPVYLEEKRDGVSVLTFKPILRAEKSQTSRNKIHILVLI